MFLCLKKPAGYSINKDWQQKPQRKPDDVSKTAGFSILIYRILGAQRFFNITQNWEVLWNFCGRQHGLYITTVNTKSATTPQVRGCLLSHSDTRERPVHVQTLGKGFLQSILGRKDVKLNSRGTNIQIRHFPPFLKLSLKNFTEYLGRIPFA